MYLLVVFEKDTVIKDTDGVKDYRVFKKGERIWFWDGRGDPSKIYRKFRRMVFKRDGFKCTECGSEDRKELRLHHKKPVRNYPNLYYDIDNCVTLCRRCHDKIPKKDKAEAGV